MLTTMYDDHYAQNQVNENIPQEENNQVVKENNQVMNENVSQKENIQVGHDKIYKIENSHIIQYEKISGQTTMVKSPNEPQTKELEGSTYKEPFNINDNKEPWVENNMIFGPNLRKTYKKKNQIH